MMNSVLRDDLQPTADAIQILEHVRRQHIRELPFVIWKMLRRAQRRLERDLDRHLGEEARPVGGRLIEMSGISLSESQ